ncbi:hypothetical protein [Gracilibacillus timonensis]|uniref:hypothetical protein n=2 Tax=Gracilibacillus TaxID=74385 RepID=UPI0008259B90|nr:hypothetical protein [Gracilibacillus timonensis]
MKATIDDIHIACFCMTLALIMIAWVYSSMLLAMIALTSLSINLFIDAFKEWRQGNTYFFSQSLVRGLGLIGTILLILFI